MKSFILKPLSIFLILCLGIIVYSNTFYCPFHFDDHSFIMDNDAIRNFQDLSRIWQFYPCRFFTFLSFAVNYHFHQLKVPGYHMVNLAIHLLSAILVWWLTLLTLSTPALNNKVSIKKSVPPDLPGTAINGHADLIALFAGLIFVSHPLQTEAVTFIWQRTASMAAFFYLASICFYAQSRLLKSDKSNESLRIIFYTLSLCTALVAMFTKETVITLPLMIVLYEITFLKEEQGINWRLLLPFLLIIFVIPLTTLLTHSENVKYIKGTVDVSKDISPSAYVLTQFRVMMTYLRLIFLPFNQNLDYDYPISKSFFELPTLLSFISIIGILITSLRLFSKYRILSFSIFWFFLTLLPESIPYPVKDVIFEHRLYLPLAGFCLFIASGAYYLLGKKTVTAMIIVLSLIIGCNSVLTYQRNKIWKDDLTLWDDTVKKSPHRARPYNNRGLSYFYIGRYDQALLDYDKAIELNPQLAEAYSNRAVIYDKQNNDALALSDYNQAIKLNPYNPKDLTNRGLINDRLGNLTQALSDYTRAIELDPRMAEAYGNRGVVDDKQNNFTQALSDYTKAIELAPGFTQAYDNRGTIYARHGDYTRALSDYNKALELNPNFTDASNNRNFVLGKQRNLLLSSRDKNYVAKTNTDQSQFYYSRGLDFVKQNRISEAITAFNQTLKLNPQHSAAYNNRGLIYENQNKFPQAFADLNKAIEINPHYADAYYNRGNAYYHTNDFTGAIADYTQAIDIDPGYTLAYTNRAIAYYQIKEFTKAWNDVHQAENLKVDVNPALIKALEQATASQVASTGGASSQDK